jgi:hypothetical protein
MKFYAVKDPGHTHKFYLKHFLTGLLNMAMEQKLLGYVGTNAEPHCRIL